MGNLNLVSVKFNSAKVIANDYSTKSLKENPNQYSRKPVCGDTLATYPDLEKDALAAFHKDVSPRNTTEFFYFSNISNMLHVLLGCRPVAANREIYNGIPSRRERLKLIDEIAKRAYYKIDNEPYVEFTQGKKPFRNSHAQIKTHDRETNITLDGYITWESFKKKAKGSKIYQKTYEELMCWAKEFGIDNPEKDYSIISFMAFIRDRINLEEMKEKEDFVTAVKDFLLGKKADFKGITHNAMDFKTAVSYIPRTYNTAPTPKVSLNGEIRLFLTDDELNLFKNAKGVATLLDGGVATLDPIENSKRIDDEDMDEFIDMAIAEGFLPVKNLPSFGENK